MSIALIIGILSWLYGLTALKRAKLPAYYFIFGSVGFFFILFFLSRTYIMWLMVRVIMFGVSLVSTPLGLAQAFPDSGTFVITHDPSSIFLSIDYECSGVLETIAFWALLFFFPIYTLKEKIRWAMIGFVWIYLANFLRIILILSMVHFLGTSWFFFVHSILGRLVFYVLVVFFYYTVFTYAQLSKGARIGGKA